MTSPTTRELAILRLHLDNSRFLDSNPSAMPSAKGKDAANDRVLTDIMNVCIETS